MSKYNARHVHPIYKYKIYHSSQDSQWQNALCFQAHIHMGVVNV